MLVYDVTRAQLRAARTWLGWTQADLAEHSGVSRITISNIESGESQPTVPTMKLLVRALENAGVDLGNDSVGLRRRRSA